MPTTILECDQEKVAKMFIRDFDKANNFYEQDRAAELIEEAKKVGLYGVAYEMEKKLIF